MYILDSHTHVDESEAFGWFDPPEAIQVAEKYENIYLDTSAMPYPNMIKTAVDRIGANRVIFGSDGPGCNPALEIKKVKLSDLDEKQLTLVLGENILEILEKSR